MWNKFSPEVRERAMRMVREQRGEYPSLCAAVESIAPKIGILKLASAFFALSGGSTNAS